MTADEKIAELQRLVSHLRRDHKNLVERVQAMEARVREIEKQRQDENDSFVKALGGG